MGDAASGARVDALPGRPSNDDELGPWVRACDVPISSLIGPPHVVRRTLARAPEASAGRAGAGAAAIGAPPWPGAAPFAADARVRAYRLYLIKHCVIMTPLVYVLVISRAWFAAQIHSGESVPDALHAAAAGRSLRLLYRTSWGLLLASALAGSFWAVRNPGVLRRRAAPSEALLTRLVAFDCLLSALNATAMMEFASRRDRECPRAASMADCLLRSYWPSTHTAFITKWVGSSYPPQVVFASELFRTVSFALGAFSLVHSRDGPAAALNAAFLVRLALRACASMAFTLFTVALWLPRTRLEMHGALPQRLLDATCPAPLRRARDACCALAAATAAAARAALQPLPHGTQLSAMAAAEGTRGGGMPAGMPPIGITAFSLLIAILNNDVRLHTIGRMQVWFFWAGIGLQALTDYSAPSLLDVVEADAGCEGSGSGRAVQPQLSWSDVEMGEALGRGSYATVHAAQWRGTSVALKCWLADGADGDAAAEARVLAEAALLMTLRHPNILTVYGVLPRPRALVMERGVCTLAQLLAGEEARAGGLHWTRRVDLARDVAAGVEFLHAHEPPIIHGDITCSNVLLAADGHAKLSDFGTSFVSSGGQGPLSMCCVEYAAPEVLRRQAVLVPQAVDVYSFGMVLQRIAAAPQRSGRESSASARSGSGSVPRFLRTVATVYSAERRRFQPPLPLGCPEEFAALVRACCAEAPAQRPPLAELRRDLDAARARASAWATTDW